MLSDRNNLTKLLLDLLVEIEEKSAQLLSTLGELEVGAWLEPCVVGDGWDDWVVRISCVRDGINVCRHFLDVTLEGLEGDVALVLGVIGVLLKAKNDTLIDVPSGLTLSNSVCLQLCQGGYELSGGNGANGNNWSQEDSTKVFHLFLSNYFNIL